MSIAIEGPIVTRAARRRPPAALVAAVALAVSGVSAVPAGAAGDRGPERAAIAIAIAIAPEANAHDINERGVAVGYRFVDQEQHAYRWRRGELVDLGPGIAEGVNDAGTVVGSSDGHAVAWQPDGSVVPLAPGRAYSSALDINRHGTVVGNSSDGPFVLPPGATEPVVLPLPAGQDGASASATAINDHGMIVGYLAGADGSSWAGLVWQGPDHDVSMLPGTTNFVYIADVNNRGVIVGDTLEREGSRALRWTDPARPPDEVSIPGTNSVARGINDHGVVIGGQLGLGNAFRWDPRTRGTTILSGLGGASADAWAINNRGDVVGFSSFAGSGYATVFARP